MTTYQTNSNGLVAYKKQSLLGTAASGSGASQLRIAGGNGIKLSKAAINSNEVRSDGAGDAPRRIVHALDRDQEPPQRQAPMRNRDQARDVAHLTCS